MQATQVHLVRKSFAEVERRADVAALVFYRRLFELAPAVRHLFKTDIHEQSRKLMDMLGIGISMLERPADLAGELEQLGAAHVGYGARREHYPIVRQALLDMLAEVNAERFTPEVHDAWNELYDFIETAMLRGANKSIQTASKGARVA